MQDYFITEPNTDLLLIYEKKFYKFHERAPGVHIMESFIDANADNVFFFLFVAFFPDHSRISKMRPLVIAFVQILYYRQSYHMRVCTLYWEGLMTGP